MNPRHQQEIRSAIGFARERGWKIVNKSCLTFGASKRKNQPGQVKVCPLMAFVLMKGNERALKAQLKKGSVHPDNVARRAAKLLGIRPLPLEQFMGDFDNNEEDPHGWPRGTDEETKQLACDWGDFGHALRKELKARAT